MRIDIHAHLYHGNLAITHLFNLEGVIQWNLFVLLVYIMLQKVDGFQAAYGREKLVFIKNNIPKLEVNQINAKIK